MTPFIISGMGLRMIVIVYSVMVALLAALSFGQYAVRQPASLPARPPAPNMPALEDLTAGYGVTNREIEVLRFLIEGKNTAEIAEAMSITDKSVRNYVSSLLSKTASSSRGKMVARFAYRFPVKAP
jgi:DNA-binding NarL/FixJ family response regulator